MLLLAAVLTTAGLLGCGERPEPAPAVMDARTRALLMEGTQALEGFDFERALALVDSAETHAPDLPDVYFLRGRILSEMLRFDEAEAAYRKVLALQPAYRGLFHNLGNNAFRQGHFQEAVALYRKELAQHPAAVPWQGMARAFRELGQSDSVRFALTQALAADSTFAPAYLALAQFYEEGGEPEQALVHARQALTRAPQNEEVRFTVGSLLLQTGRAEEALAHLRPVAEARPWHAPTLYNLGQALIRTGREEEAQSFLEEAEALRALEARITQAEITVQGNPKDPYAHAGLGSALRQARRYDEALHAYRVALFLAPGNLEFQNNVAVLHLLQGDDDAAIQWFERILQQDPSFVHGWLNLGIVYARSGRTEEARRAWQAALRLEPGHPAAQAYLARLDGRS